MPSYNYRSDDPGCEDCAGGFDVFQNFQDPPITTCRACNAGVRRVIRLGSLPGIKIRHGLRGDCRDYRSDLARFPGDPQAYTDGPAAVKKLLDQRLREGWRIREEGWQENPTHGPRKTNEELVREAYKRAEAKGFQPDNKEI